MATQDDILKARAAADEAAQQAAAALAAASESHAVFAERVSKLLAASTALSAVLEPPPPPPPPPTLWSRVWGYQIGGRKGYDEPSYMAAMKMPALIVVGVFVGWHGDVAGSKLAPLVRALKAQNPAQLVTFYENFPEVYPTDASAADYRDECIRSGWLLLDSAGNRLPSRIDANQLDVNICAKPNAEGLSPPVWFARRCNTRIAAVAPWDGWMVDNTNWRTRQYTPANWRQDGTFVNGKETLALQTAFRSAVAEHLREARRLQPGMVIVGNPDANGDTCAAELPELAGLLDYAIFEGAIGSGYARERSDGWAAMMLRYRSTQRGARKAALFQVHGKRSDYQLLRYGLASALLDDGLFCYALTDYNTTAGVDYDDVPVFDEYALRLGKPLGGSFILNGAAVREYQGGMVVANSTKPAGATATGSTVSVDLAVYGMRAFGPDDIGRAVQSAVNDGKPVSMLTLPPRDGRVLVRA